MQATVGLLSLNFSLCRIISIRSSNSSSKASPAAVTFNVAGNGFDIIKYIGQAVGLQRNNVDCFVEVIFPMLLQHQLTKRRKPRIVPG